MSDPTIIHFRPLTGTRAAEGCCGAHSVIADRPEGRAGGSGLGFNGGEFLAFAVGGCLANDLQYTADEMGVEISDFDIEVRVEFVSDPMRAKSIEAAVRCDLSDGANARDLVTRAFERGTIANSLREGIPVSLNAAIG